MGNKKPQQAQQQADIVPGAAQHGMQRINLGADARLDARNLVGDGLRRVIQIQRLALARAHGHMPVHTTLGLWAFVRILVARVSKGISFFAVQQLVRLGHIVDVGCRAFHAVHQARVGIHANVRLHAEVPLVALLGLMHLGITLAFDILSRARRRDQRGIHCRARLQQQPLVGQQVVDDAQHVGGQVMLVQQMPKPQDRALVGQAIEHAIELGKLAVHRHVMQRFFHRRIAQAKPLLQVMDAQHGLDGKGWAARLGLGPVRLDHADQHIPRHNFVHLLQELALARLLCRWVQSQADLLHVFLPRINSMPSSCKTRALRPGFADHP
jgi:hypothetical protein